MQEVTVRVPASTSNLGPGFDCLGLALRIYNDVTVRRKRAKSLPPMIAGLEGRTSDLLVTSDGRRVFWLNPVFYGLPVRQSQIVQETPRRIRARFVPAPEFADSNAETIVERLRKRLGDLEIVLEPVAELPRSPSGKVHHKVNHVETRRQQMTTAPFVSVIIPCRDEHAFITQFLTHWGSAPTRTQPSGGRRARKTG